MNDNEDGDRVISFSKMGRDVPNPFELHNSETYSLISCATSTLEKHKCYICNVSLSADHNIEPCSTCDKGCMGHVDCSIKFPDRKDFCKHTFNDAGTIIQNLNEVTLQDFVSTNNNIEYDDQMASF